MQQLSYRFCPKCKWEGESADVLCPRCRKKTMTRGFIRGTGAALVALGGFLVLIMTPITIFMIGVVQGTKPGASGPRFTGTKVEMYMMFGIFGFVFLFGFNAIIAGLWQLIVGRRNMVLVYFILALGVVFFVGGNLILILFDR